MGTITKQQYEYALERIEYLLPLVDDSTPFDDKNSIELELVSNIVMQYEEDNFPMPQPTVGEYIQGSLSEYNMTARQLASHLGVSSSCVSDLVHGKREPSLRQAAIICKVLHIDPEDMMDAVLSSSVEVGAERKRMLKKSVDSKYAYA